MIVSLIYYSEKKSKQTNIQKHKTKYTNMLQSSRISRKSGAFIVRYSQKEE